MSSFIDKFTKASEQTVWGGKMSDNKNHVGTLVVSKLPGGGGVTTTELGDAPVGTCLGPVHSGESGTGQLLLPTWDLHPDMSKQPPRKYASQHGQLEAKLKALGVRVPQGSPRIY
jgi:hypothetical protein